jgi:hypothetical protein
MSAEGQSLSGFETRPLVREPGRERRGAVILPREHGACGFLLVAWITVCFCILFVAAFTLAP